MKHLPWNIDICFKCGCRYFPLCTIAIVQNIWYNRKNGKNISQEPSILVTIAVEQVTPELSTLKQEQPRYYLSRSWAWAEWGGSWVCVWLQVVTEAGVSFPRPVSGSLWLSSAGTSAGTCPRGCRNTSQSLAREGIFSIANRGPYPPQFKRKEQESHHHAGWARLGWPGLETTIGCTFSGLAKSPFSHHCLLVPGPNCRWGPQLGTDHVKRKLIA